MATSSDGVDQLLFGRDPGLSTTLVAVAGGAFFLAAGVRTLSLLSAPTPAFGTLWSVVAATMLLLAGASAYLNDGLMISIALAAGVGLGFFTPEIALGPRELEADALRSITSGTLSGVVFGAVGFAVGAVLCRLRRRL
ncbi:MAG: hypothetical protein ABEJ79_11865 [Halolamina sp.]